eukprot:6181206-Pleurochrysis_carterae.AAC.11
MEKNGMGETAFLADSLREPRQSALLATEEKLPPRCAPVFISTHTLRISHSFGACVCRARSRISVVRELFRPPLTLVHGDAH